MIVSIEFIENNPVSIKLPEHIIEKVTDTEAVIKGQTADHLLNQQFYQMVIK